jgi:hypothetical protein
MLLTQILAGQAERLKLWSRQDKQHRMQWAHSLGGEQLKSQPIVKDEDEMVDEPARPVRNLEYPAHMPANQGKRNLGPFVTVSCPFSFRSVKVFSDYMKHINAVLKCTGTWAKMYI